ncbi:PfaD family polyunsaturated fatty acid/polyketide biosynthesis protein [Nocardia nepalensis]|uniref:PfaD family polyunsaturated fatty acid/polyketide biosynthesis protein n=1 Tax=Nocardia nepalensis TaxID=3375448 RepID=UPI003B66DB99
MTIAPEWMSARDVDGIRQVLADLEQPCYVVRGAEGIGVASAEPPLGRPYQVLAAAGPLPPARLGSQAFLRHHGVRFPYMSGAMAGGIASEDLVIALAANGYLASFGAAGLLPDRIEAALQRFQREIPGLPYACNLIHSPAEEGLERAAVELYLRFDVRCVEASAYLGLTRHIVRYRVAGLARDPHGRIVAGHRVIAKLSRAEVAEQFMRPAPAAIVAELVRDGLITADQAELARQVPMADDITVEADSGGHTDRRPLPALLPAVLMLRDRVEREQGYATPIRVGAAGGIGTPQAVCAAFAAGAAYVVTGSVNQSCRESGASSATKAMLAAAAITDCEMAPAADMFELGVQLQVLRKGTLFPMRARRLYELYCAYDGIDALPADERHKLETQFFRRPLEHVWQETVAYFEQRDPAQLERASGSEKRRMALIFRWYLGMSSRWSGLGQPDRVADYQIWCGPAMGSFNDWVRGSYLEPPENRRVVAVAHHLMHGAAYLSRVMQLRFAGVGLPSRCLDYRLTPIESLGQ